MKKIANYSLMRRLQILTTPFEESPMIKRKYLGFNDFSAAECRNYFHCAKPHLNKMKACLRIPRKIKFKNNWNQQQYQGVEDVQLNLKDY